jgi:hypothetical protein
VVIFTLRMLYLFGKSPSTHWIGSWEEFRAIMNAVERRKITYLAENQITIVQPVIIPTELSWLLGGQL